MKNNQEKLLIISKLNIEDGGKKNEVINRP